MNRRHFLKSAAALAGGAAAQCAAPFSVGRASLPAGLPELLAPASADADSNTDGRPRLVVVLLRGAVDGLGVVPPHADPAYHAARPTIALAPSAVLDLDGRFAMHPALAPLMPLWRERSLAFVHACGSPDPSRSHFDAQDYLESATPGVKTTPDGWLNRLLAVLPGPHRPTDALNLGPTVPRILSGPIPVANLPAGRAAARPMSIDRPRVEQSFARMYRGSDPLSRAFQQGYEAHERLRAELERDMTAADNGAPYPDRAFAEGAARLGRLMARDPSIRIAFAALGGWDTHVNQGAAQGQLANHLRALGEGLVSLARNLGPAYAQTVVLVMSEFGRTVHENGNGGTDHGHGNVIWVLGGPVRGAKIYGSWPGLEEGNLYQGRDLAVTTDFRAVINTVIRRHMGLDAAASSRVLPGFSPRHTQMDDLLRA